MKTLFYTNQCLLVVLVFFGILHAETPVLDNIWNYEHDVGESFADRGNGHMYGWSSDKTGSVQDAGSAVSPDERYDSGMALSSGDRWELALEPGYYRVSITAGNPVLETSVQHLLVEGQEVLNTTPPDDWPWVGAVMEVQVTDGRLTVEAGVNASGTILNQIHVLSTQGGTFDTPTKANLPLKVNTGEGVASGEYLADKPLVPNGDYGYVLDPLTVRAVYPDTATLTNFDGKSAYESMRTTTSYDIPLLYQVRLDPDTQYEVKMGFANTETDDANKMVYEVHSHDALVMAATDLGVAGRENQIRDRSFMATSDSEGILHLEIRSVGTLFPFSPRVSYIEVDVFEADSIRDQAVGVNFYQNTDGMLPPTDRIGVVEAPNWNNLSWATRGQALSGLVQGDGSPSAVTVNFSGDNMGYPPSFNAAISEEAPMLKNALGRNSASVTLGNLESEFPNGFDLYVYTWGGSQLAQNRKRSFQLTVPNTPTYFNVANGAAPSGTWTRSDQVTSATATSGNYVLWENLLDVDSLTITGSKVETGPYITGLQLVPRPAPPRSYNQAYKDVLFAGDPRGTSGAHTEFDAKANGNIQNGLIFAFGIDNLDPIASVGRLPKVDRVTDEGQDYFAIRFRRLTGGTGDLRTVDGYHVAGVRYVVQWANQLMPEDWRSGSAGLELVSVETHEDGTETVVVRRKTDISSAESLPEFLRATVELLP